MTHSYFHCILLTRQIRSLLETSFIALSSRFSQIPYNVGHTIGDNKRVKQLCGVHLWLAVIVMGVRRCMHDYTFQTFPDSAMTSKRSSLSNFV